MAENSGTDPQVIAVTAAGLEAQAERLGQRVEQLHRMQGTGKYITLLLIVVIVAEFAVFYFTTRRNVEANFSSQSIQQAMSQRLPQMVPQLRDLAVKAGQNALPIYRQLAVERFQQVGPDVAEDAMKRLRNIPEDVGNELGASLSKAFDQTIAQLRPDILKTYPTLSDAQKTDLLKVALYDKIEQQNQVILGRITSISDREKTRMTAVLAKFAPSTTVAPGSSRERVFLHTLVDVLLDTNLQTDVLAADAVPAPPAKVVKPTVKEISGQAKPAGTQISSAVEGN